MADEGFSIELKGLDQLLKALKVKPPVVRIGVIGTQARTPKKGQSKAPTNAEVGAIHEFGAPARGIPQRSFLRIPLMENLNKGLEQSGLVEPEILKAVIKKGSVEPWLEKVGVVAMGIVMGAFDTAGYGRWPSLSSGYTNEGGTPLIDTGQLRDAISYEIKGGT